MKRPKKHAFGKCPAELESGRDRNKRLKKMREKRREARRLKLENETPQQREIRLERLRKNRRNREIVRAAIRADKFAAELTKIIPPTNDELEDHPAISMKTLVGFSVDKTLDYTKFVNEEPSETEESASEGEDVPEGTFKLNKYKVQCLKLQKELDLWKVALMHENRKKNALEEELHEIRRKARMLEDLYEIPLF